MADKINTEDPSLIWDENDSRKSCKYGIECYRKEKDHIKKFKHPKRKLEEDDGEENVKKAKVEESESGYVRDTDTPKDEEQSKDAAEKDTSPSENPRQFIKNKFLVEMPEDFYDFWEFCKTNNKKDPKNALKETLDLQLVGPFDVLNGRCKSKNSRDEEPCYLTHWRYYYDPPEFITVLRGDDKTQFHLGYFRDDPKELPAFVASNSAASNGTFSSKGDNLFAAIKLLTDEIMKKEKNATKKKSLSSLSSSLVKFAKDKGYSLEAKTQKMKARDKKVVCKSFHGAGIVVPVDDNGVGYREVPETTGDLKRMFKRIASSENEEERNKNLEPLEEIICLVQFANDECDYGEGLELGMDMFTFGGNVFHSMIGSLLTMAYQLLGRNEYAEILTAHLANRKHTADLDELS